MLDEVPEPSRHHLLKPSFTSVHEVGDRCQISEYEDGWRCAHGTTSKTATQSSDDEDYIPRSVGIDPRQARIYWRARPEGGAPDVAIITPDDFLFRKSRKGRVGSRSKSFDDEGAPAPQVLLLYAIKSQRYEDRLRALDALEPDDWWWSQELLAPREVIPERPTFGDIFSTMRRLAGAPLRFEALVGQLMAESCRDKKGLADWRLWEEVADRAMMEAGELDDPTGEGDGGHARPFLQAVKDCTVTHGGVPAQSHVRERFKELTDNSNREVWKAVRKRLGFDWLPPLADWKVSRHPTPPEEH